VVTTPALAEAAGAQAESLGPQALKGFDEAVELCRLV
jgi:class 3 adenylate cyclase